MAIAKLKAVFVVGTHSEKNNKQNLFSCVRMAELSRGATRGLVEGSKPLESRGSVIRRNLGEKNVFTKKLVFFSHRISVKNFPEIRLS